MDGRRWRSRIVEEEADLSHYGHVPYVVGRPDLFRARFDGPPTDDTTTRTRTYIVLELLPDDSNERARVADDDATLRWQMPEVAPGSRADDCAICLQDLAGSSPEKEEATPRAMPCSHVFHERCIFQWIRQNRACPLCRRPLPTPQQQKHDYHDDDRLQLTMPVPREMLEIEVLL